MDCWMEDPGTEKYDCSVVIIGGGPCGLVLAIELGRRNVPVILLEEKSSPARFPAANATQARTMEHFRRLGFAEKVRAQGLPPDYPTDIAYFTRYTRHELARFGLPSARAAREIVKTLTGSWSAAELPHRVSQMFVEDVLRAEAAACPSVSMRAGWRMTAVRETGAGVEINAEHPGGRTTLRAAYAMGADGGGSPTRKALDYGFVGESGVVRDFMGGRMFAFYFRSPELYKVIPHPRAWMYVAVNSQRRAFMASINGHDQFTFHTQLRPGQLAERISDAEAKAMFHEALAAPLDVEIIARSAWNAGYTLVAERFQRGRIFLGGDAAHLFTPTGGLGYNTAVEDAVNIGWKFAAVLHGWGGPTLLHSYEMERQPIARRNTAYARGFANSLDCLSRRRNWKTTAPPAKPRATLQATISAGTPGANSTFPVSPSAAVTTARRSSYPMAQSRPRIAPIHMNPQAVLVVGRRICGLRTADPFTMPSASTSRCSRLAQDLRMRRHSMRQPQR